MDDVLMASPTVADESEEPGDVLTTRLTPSDATVIDIFPQSAFAVVGALVPKKVVAACVGRNALENFS